MLRSIKERLYKSVVINGLMRPGVRDVYERHVFFSRAFQTLAFNRIDGDYAEFGCYSGTTFWLAYEESRRFRHPAHLWAFDSFEGLPPPQSGDHHPGWSKGDMSTSLEQFRSICRTHGIQSKDYSAVKGIYSETLPVAEEPRNIALAYIDCDLYSSTVDVLRFLKPRLKHGMIIAFDDYYCWSPDGPSGERQAFLEVLAGDERWALQPFLRFGAQAASFYVEKRQEAELSEPD